ncbi:MAG: hypothetical protein KA712_24285 [Myxococcales bacterium]|nr:hypothetical protein [Myxococcales bacterium]
MFKPEDLRDTDHEGTKPPYWDNVRAERTRFRLRQSLAAELRAPHATSAPPARLWLASVRLRRITLGSLAAACVAFSVWLSSVELAPPPHEHNFSEPSHKAAPLEAPRPPRAPEASEAREASRNELRELRLGASTVSAAADARFAVGKGNDGLELSSGRLLVQADRAPSGLRITVHHWEVIVLGAAYVTANAKGVTVEVLKGVAKYTAKGSHGPWTVIAFAEAPFVLPKPGFLDLWLEAKRFASAGLWEKARSRLDEARQVAPNDHTRAAINFEEAQTWLRSGEPNKARAALRAALVDDPDGPVAPRALELLNHLERTP